MIRIGDEYVDSVSTLLELAVNEIYYSYGDRVRIKRKSLHKFGQNTSLGTTEESVNFDGIDVVRPTTNSITHFSSSNAGDTTQTLRVEGMFFDASNNFRFTVQNINLNGQTKTALATPLCRVTRIANVASTTATAGDVYIYEDGAITGGVPNDLNTVGNVMSAFHQTTTFSGTSVASTNYFILTNMYAFLAKDSPQGAIADIRMKIRQKDSIFRSISIGTLTSQAILPLIPYAIIPPNHDMDIVATAGAANTSIEAGFYGVFADIN